MECDRSRELEASLSVIFYHALLVSETLASYKVPQTLLNCERRNAVVASRNFDRLVSREHSDLQLNECLRSVLNCNINYVSPVSLLKMLANKCLSNQCLSLLQRKDFVDHTIQTATDPEFAQFWSITGSVYSEQPREYLAFLQMY